MNRSTSGLVMASIEAASIRSCATDSVSSSGVLYALPVIYDVRDRGGTTVAKTEPYIGTLR